MKDYYEILNLDEKADIPEIEKVLKESFKNPAFLKSKYQICVQLAYVLSLEGKFDESLKYMEMLLKLDASECEKIDSGEILLSSIDFFLENELYEEANRCMGIIIRVLPDREDIAEIKKHLEKMLKLEPEFIRFEDDEAIPDGLVGLIVNRMCPEALIGITKEQKEAYDIINEYQILNDYSIYLMPLRYMKNKYPDIYSLKENFFDELQDSKKRKILKTKYQTLIYKYQAIFDEMMDKLDDELYDEYDEEERSGYEAFYGNRKDSGDAGHSKTAGHSKAAGNSKAGSNNKTGKNNKAGSNNDSYDERMSNVRPFIRKEDRIKKSDP